MQKDSFCPFNPHIHKLFHNLAYFMIIKTTLNRSKMLGLWNLSVIHIYTCCCGYLV